MVDYKLLLVAIIKVDYISLVVTKIVDLKK